MTDINFDCPHCGHHYEDELELLDNDVLHDFKCESCAKHFQVLIQECSKCRADTVTVWRETPTWEAVALIACGSCGHSFTQHDALEEDEF